MLFSKRIRQVRFSGVVKFSDRLRELAAAGKKIIHLEVGEPHFDTPKEATDAMIAAARSGQTHYGHSRGLFELRSSICNFYNKKFKANLNPDKNILVTPGAKQALLYAALCFLNPGDEAVIPEPEWPSYGEIVKLAGARPVVVAGDREKDFEIEFYKIKHRVTPKTRMIFLNSPVNPTGRMVSRDNLLKIYKLCLKKNIMLLCDEIYDQIIFKKFSKNFSILAINPSLKNSFLISGFSKTFAMTGWRLGYVLAEEAAIDAMLKIQQNSVTCSPTFVQCGAVKILKNDNGFVKKSLKFYLENRKLVLTALKNMPKFRAINSEGGLYIFLDISKHTKNSFVFAQNFLHNYGVAVTPGAVFGRSAEGCVRICLATEKKNIIEFVKRLQKYYEN